MHHEHPTRLEQLASNVAMGLIVAATLFVFTLSTGASITPVSVRLRLLDYAQSVSHRLFSTAASALRLRLVNVPTSSAQGDVGRISRDDLAKIVTTADNAGAKVIVLDVDLRGPSKGNAALSSALAGLKNATAALNLQLTQRASGACRARTDLDPRGNANADEVGWPDGYAAAAWPRVRFASAEFEDDVDESSRSICPFSTALSTQFGSASPEKVLIPSLAVLAVALALDSGIPTRWSAAAKSHGRWGGLPDPNFNGLTVADFEPRKLHFQFEKPKPGADGQTSPVLAANIRRFPAALLDGQPADLTDLAGAVVIIGSEDVAAGDQKKTPFGQMSGLLLVGNAIDAASKGDFLEPHENPWADFGGEVLLILIGSALFVSLYAGLLEKWGWAQTPQTTGQVQSLFWETRRIAWFLLVSLIVGVVLIAAIIAAAALGIHRGSAPDPAASILSVLAERIIHAGAFVDEWVKEVVRVGLKRLGLAAPKTSAAPHIKSDASNGDH